MNRQYEPLIRQLIELPLSSLVELESTSEKSLAIVILLNQISRNILRSDNVVWVFIAYRIGGPRLERAKDKTRTLNNLSVFRAHCRSCAVGLKLSTLHQRFLAGI